MSDLPGISMLSQKLAPLRMFIDRKFPPTGTSYCCVSIIVGGNVDKSATGPISPMKLYCPASPASYASCAWTACPGPCASDGTCDPCATEEVEGAASALVSVGCSGGVIQFGCDECPQKGSVESRRMEGPSGDRFENCWRFSY